MKAIVISILSGTSKYLGGYLSIPSSSILPVPSYSIAAINQYGAWRGIVLTADRLLHEADEGKHAVVLQIGSRQCYFDPVENNDFLWRK